MCCCLGLQWTAPEILREYYADLDDIRYRFDVGTQPGDVYSVGVIMKEVFARNDPYSEYELMDLKGTAARRMARSRF